MAVCSTSMPWMPAVSINYNNVIFIGGQPRVAVPTPLPFLPPTLVPAFIPKFRIDLRKLLVFSIDPIGCKDIDDALHCRELSNGNYEIGVHIADVTEFVFPGTSVDNEILQTGKSIKVIDSNIAKLCSINPGSDKLTFSVIWEITSNAEFVSIKYVKSIIRSRVALSYNEVQERIDNDSLNDPFTTNLRILNRLSKCFRLKRRDRGALLEGKNERKEANILVEEFMILANISVAEKIYRHFPQFSLLRRLPNPKPTTNKYMSKVEYIFSQNIDKKDLYHNGIGKYLYTHFTSPIRRNADIHVHRLLAAALGITKVPHMYTDKSYFIDIIDKLNTPPLGSI